MRQELPEATIIRPSFIYGDEDRFWNRLGGNVFRDKYLAQSRWRGGIYLPGSGDVRMRPVYVGDVAAIMAKLVRDDKAVGQIVELYGYIF